MPHQSNKHKFKSSKKKKKTRFITNKHNSLENVALFVTVLNVWRQSFVDPGRSTLHTNLQRSSIPVWIPGTALKHFKKPRAKDECAVTEKSTTTKHKTRVVAGRECKRRRAFFLRELGANLSLLCDAHLYNRSSWRLHSPSDCDSLFFFFYRGAHKHIHTQTTTHFLFAGS